jgi:hypothetical protein
MKAKEHITLDTLLISWIQRRQRIEQLEKENAELRARLADKAMEDKK